MKKTSLALIAAISMLGSVVAHATDAAPAAGVDADQNAVGGITAGAIAVGAVTAGILIAANGSDGNPITNPGTSTTSTSSN